MQGEQQKMSFLWEEQVSRAQGEGAAAIYCRVSRKDSMECGESQSIHNQMELAWKAVQQEDELCSRELLYFCDDGYTGTNMNRPAVQKMLAGIFMGKIQALVVKDFSRLSRNHLELAELLEVVFPRYQVRVVSIADHYDSRKGPPGMQEALKNIFYEYYCRDISRKTKNALRAKRECGEGRPGRVPYGYRRGADGKLTVDAQEAERIRQIYEMSIQGEACSRIARKMENRETDGKKKWYASTVWRILHDPVYMGTETWHKYENRYRDGFVTVRIPEQEWKKRKEAVPEIISEKMFQKSQDMHPLNHDLCGKKGKRHLFHGITKCGYCGSALCRHRTQKELLVCDGDHEENRIGTAALLSVCRWIFGMPDDPETAVGEMEIFLKLFVKKICVKQGKIRILAKVIIESEQDI